MKTETLTPGNDAIDSKDAIISLDKNGTDSKIETPTLNKNILDLVSKNYDESELLQIIGFDGSMDDLNTQYPIECLKKDSSIYRVSYLGNDKIAVLLFDESGNKILGRIHSFKQLKANFSELAEGQSLEEVMEIDPDGEYLFLYSGRNDVPRVSSHYTKDGYLITIEYDYSNNIISISEKLI